MISHQPSAGNLHAGLELGASGAIRWSTTFGTLKGVGRVYQQTFVDTYSKVALCKLYTTKTPITAADILNERVLPVFEENEMSLLRMLTDRGTEFCGKVEQHDYELYLAVNGIEHTKTKARHPQTNGICERFHKTILQEFYQITFRKKIYSTLDELQNDLDDWIYYYNYERTHQGKMCCGRTPMETFIDGKKIWQEKVDSLNLSDNISELSSKELAEEMSRLRALCAPEGLGLDISEATHAFKGVAIATLPCGEHGVSGAEPMRF